MRTQVPGIVYRRPTIPMDVLQPQADSLRQRVISFVVFMSVSSRSLLVSQLQS